MNIYRIEFTEVGANVCWSKHIGVAETPERAIDLAMEAALHGWDQKEAPVELELRSLELIGTCDFMQKKLRRVA